MAPFRRSPSPFVPLLGLLVLCGLLAVPSWGVRAGPGAPPGRSRTRLAVLVVFDQMRGDYLTRWQDLFGEGGFRRLERDGAWFQDCHYPYGHTVTAAGHASVATGCAPATHGIVDNEWYDRDGGQRVAAVSSDRYEQVPPAPRPEKEGAKKPAGVSPERLLAPTVGDALKAATGGRGRVVSISFKDRSAVLPGGRRPDACYWCDLATGNFVTSSYYRDRPDPWVTAFNQGKPADRWFGRDWSRLRGDIDYERFSGPDDVAGEGRGIGQGRTFPHPLTGGKDRPGREYHQALEASPFGNELLLQLVERAVDEEQLGRHDDPDLLCVSFSSNDLIGHVWGPDSQEVLDVTLRSDQVVQRLLTHLDAQVGRDNYLLVLTADHGVCPLPEVSSTRGEEAGRISTDFLARRAGSFLDTTFGAGPADARWFEAMAGPWIYLNQRLLRQRGLPSAKVEDALAGWLKHYPGIETAYTRTDLLKGIPADDAVGQAVRRSFYPGRCGDVAVVPKPYYVYGWITLTGTTHGTPHEYDTHVPLLVFGPGVRAGVSHDRVTPLAAAAILAHGLGIPPPARAEAPVPAGLFTSPAGR